MYATARKLESMEGLEHPNVKKLVMDVTNADHIEDVVSDVITIEGRIDILINNAGVACAGERPELLLSRTQFADLCNAGPILDVTLDQVRKTFETNTFGALALSKAVIPHMARRSKGLVVNISSVMGEM